MPDFWADSDDDSAEEEPKKPTVSTVKPRRGDSDDEEDEGPALRRVVRSQKDKRFEEINNTIQNIRNYMKINDWNSIHNDFEKLNRQLTKATTVIQKEGIPNSYIKILVQLEDFLKKTAENKEAKKKMSAPNSKSLNAMKQKLKKNNKQYETQIEYYRKNPDESEDEKEASEEASEAGSDDDAGVSDDDVGFLLVSKKPIPEKEKPKSTDQDKAFLKEKPFAKKPSQPLFNEDQDDDEEDEESLAPKKIPSRFAKKTPSRSDSDSDKDDESGDEVSRGEDGANKIGKWLKKATPKDEEEKKVPVKPQKGKTAKPKQPKEKDEPQSAPTKVADKIESEPVVYTKEIVDKKLKEIIAYRGKKGYDRTEQIEKLAALIDKAKTPDQEIEVYVNVVAAQFDVNPNMTTHMPIPLWKSCYKNLMKIVQLLSENKSIILQGAEEEVDSNHGDEEGSRISANLLAFVERLDDELIKSLQFIDPHTQEYVERLGDESLFLDLAERAQKYYSRINKLKCVARIAIRRMEHLYYKMDLEKDKKVGDKQLQQRHVQQTGTPHEKKEASNPSETLKGEIQKPTPGQPRTKLKPQKQDDITLVLSKLANIIYTHGDERLKTRAMLCQIYHYALYDRFYEARDMMLMSHLQESIMHMDVPTQILFNRTMVQLGLCAFRAGLISDAHSCLAELYSGGRVKELLAQGTNRYSDKNPEQEKLEKKRQIPYHMHINLELLECVHIVCAMLLEVPNMAANAFDVKRKFISRPFRRHLDYYDRQTFTGPPENTRDYVIAGAKALMSGDWQKAVSLILSVPVWSLISTNKNTTENVKLLLKRRIQEEGLRTYLFTYSSHYNSLGLSSLAEMFSLPQNHVHSLVSKMIISEELHASWNQPTGSLVLHKVEPTRLQSLALQLAEKTALFVENNERLLDSRAGGYGYNKFDVKANVSKDRWQDRGYHVKQQRYNNRQDGNFQRTSYYSSGQGGMTTSGQGSQRFDNTRRYNH